MPARETTAFHDKQLLLRLFGEVTDEQLDQILAVTEQLVFETGSYVFRQGDRENALYIVLSGRLRVLKQTPEGVRILGDVSEGEPVGEFSLFTKEPRSASVIAIRRSVVLEMDEGDYQVLISRFPGLAHTLTRFVIDRLRRNAFQINRSAAPKNIALVNLQSANDLLVWAPFMQQQFMDMGIPTQVYDHRSAHELQGQNLFGQMEQLDGLNFLICDERHEEWAHQCIVYCDLVVLVADSQAGPETNALESRLQLHKGGILQRNMYLLLLHREDSDLPRHTSRWYQNRNIDLHIHLRMNNERDIRRFCRIVSHRATGLVLGGGGSKGFAHVGAVKAMLEQGIEFDFVGGTSAGAMYGIGMTHSDFDMDRMYGICKTGAERDPTSRDYHWPFISIMTGNKMRNYIHDCLGEAEFEDVWVTTYCASTDYSAAQVKIHDRGLAWKQVSASIAIPGVFPPVILDRHLHVDGGVLDNLPVEAMYRYPVRHVIAIALSPSAKVEVDLENMPSAWSMLWDKITRTRRYDLPGFASLLINILTLNSRQKQESVKPSVDLYVELDLREFSMLDGSKWKQVIDKGYRQMREYLLQLPEERKFWKG